MTAADLLRAARAAGFRLSRDGERLLVSRPISDEWAEAFREHKAALMQLLWEESEQELCVERNPFRDCPASTVKRYKGAGNELQRSESC